MTSRQNLLSLSKEFSTTAYFTTVIFLSTLVCQNNCMFHQIFFSSLVCQYVTLTLLSVQSFPQSRQYDPCFRAFFGMVVKPLLLFKTFHSKLVCQDHKSVCRYDPCFSSKFFLVCQYVSIRPLFQYKTFLTTCTLVCQYNPFLNSKLSLVCVTTLLSIHIFCQYIIVRLFKTFTVSYDHQSNPCFYSDFSLVCQYDPN